MCVCVTGHQWGGGCLFLNYEVVVFQPQTVTPLHLVSVSYRYTFKLGLLPNLFLPFYRSFFSLLLPTVSPSLSVHCQSPLFFTRSPPPLSVQSTAHLDVTCTRHLSTSAACTCDLLHVTASITVTWDGALPPFPTLDCAQVTISPWGVCPSRVPLCLFAPDSTSLRSYINPGIIRSLVLLSVGFSHEGERPGCLN